MGDWALVDSISPTERCFWPEYRPPASHVAAEVQKPAHMVDGNTLAVAYMRDWRATRQEKAG